ncbi:DUF6883 domain-containing protein [Methylobacterium sp. SyP6R]|uniref:DUF6883 domain-containing protein n=1 Tax=Methylobacterium sp. SyP6R TaxID=2718876 RepID=UPI003FA5FCC9
MQTLHPVPPIRFAIDTLKISGYLPKLSHPNGGPKARYFINCGFDPFEPNLLAAALLAHPTLPSSVSQPPKVTIYDVRFLFGGPIESPTGLTGRVTSVWQVLPSDSVGRLITAYPF